MPTTTLKAFPYPSASDTVDVPRDIQLLAEALDAAQFGSPADDASAILGAAVFS